MAPTSKKPASSRKNRDTETLYKRGQLSLWFFVTSVLLLVGWGLMLWKDHDRQWKDYQRRFYDTMLSIERDVTKEIVASRDETDEERLERLETSVATIEERFRRQGTFENLQNLRDELHALEKDATAAANRFKSVKGDHAVAKYRFEMARLEYHSLLEEYAEPGERAEEVRARHGDVEDAYEATEVARDRLNHLSVEWDRKKREARTLEVEVEDLKDRISTIEAPLVEARKALEKAESDVTQQQEKIEGLELQYEKNQWRNAPFIDFISPTIEIEQVVLDDIHDNWNFATSPKVDRCMTCHAGIDMPTFADPEIVDDPENGVERFMRAHPHLSAMVGPESPHPMESFGCTVCHHGVGWAVEFSRCAHTPATRAERERWVEEHDYYKAKYIDFPMLPLEYVEGMCHKCHKEGIFEPVQYEERLDHGYVTDDVARGIYAQRMNTNDPLDPDFLDPEKNPVLPPNRVFRDWKMPDAPRPVGDQYLPFPSRFQVAEAARAQLREFYEDNPRFYRHDLVHDWGWSPERYRQGYDTVVTYGCQGCHKIRDLGQQVGYEESPRVGPDLTYIADKVKPEWLPLWIKHPDAYRVDTKMPSFYYFMQKDDRWEYETDGEGERRAPLAVMDAHMTDPRDDQLVNYQNSVGPISRPSDHRRFAVEILAQTQYLLNQRNPATGERWSRANPDDPRYDPLYVEEPPPGNVDRGRKLVNEVGCAACHILPEIETRDGYEPDGPARFGFDPLLMRGPRLTGLGSKIASRTWLDAWLANPRHYTSHTRMPNMRLTAQERADVLDYLLSFRDEGFDAMEAPAFKPSYVATVKDLYVEFFAKDAEGDFRDPDAVAGEIGDLTNENRLATVLAMIGERLMSRNGCFGCHAAAGHEDDQPIGTELTKEGIKNLHQLDFGRVPKYVENENGEKVPVLPHTRHGFIRTKITYPRIFDYSKQPIWQDKLKMPRFNLRMDDRLWKLRSDLSIREIAQMPREISEDSPEWREYFEIRSTRAAVAGIVLGLVEEPIKAGALYDPDAHEEDIIDGRRVADRYGCNNCHTLEGRRGYLWGWKQDNLGVDPGTLPPNLFTQGWRTRDEWLTRFLKQPEFLRPIVPVHMPDFGLSDAEAYALVKYFKRLRGRDAPMGVHNPGSTIEGEVYDQPVTIALREKRVDVRSAVEEAELLFNTINCNKCHLPPEHPLAGDDGGVAPSFELSDERLRHQWVRTLLDHPGHLISGTKMPSVYTFDRRGGRSVPPSYQPFLFELRDDAKWRAAFAGDDEKAHREAMTRLAEVQMDALTDYVLYHYESPVDAPPAPANGGK